MTIALWFTLWNCNIWVLFSHMRFTTTDIRPITTYYLSYGKFEFVYHISFVFYIDLPFCTNFVFLVDYIDLSRSPTKRVHITYQLLLFQITWLLAKFLHHKQWTVSIGLCPCFGMVPTSVSIKCSIAVQLSWKWEKLKILFGNYRHQYLEA